MELAQAPGRLVLIGSGEIGPSMAPLHRSLVSSLPKRSAPSSLVALDGSYDFQTNRAEMGERIAIFFRSKVGIPTTVIGLPEIDRAGADLAPAALAPTIAGIEGADYLFLGPGSPSRAIRRWGDTPIVERLAARIHAGATVVTSSAGAAAAGLVTIPVYEIYKAGAQASWLDGLDILGAVSGLRAAVVPHWNNSEGATHDTSRCYIGEERLRQLERTLPAETGVLGIDEHTALVLDIGAGSASVHGKGAVTIRVPGVGETALHSGAHEPIAAFAARFGTAAPTAAPSPFTAASQPAAATPTLAKEADRRADAAGASIADAVDQLLALRDAARAARRFADADALRAAVEALGVEVTDGAAGPTWRIRT